MDQKVTCSRIINSWSCLPRLNRAILLIGPSHTGRTTYAELIKKYCFDSPSPNLLFDAAKSIYNLEGVISTKSIKIHTVLPAVYEKTNKKEELKILDVPSTIFPPEMKKWTVLEQKLAIDFMVAKNSTVGFLLFIEEKNTRTNILLWKKALQNFLDLFKAEAFTDEMLSSIGMIITKAPADIKVETVVNRLKMMKTAMEKEKGANGPLIDKLFKYLLDENRIFIFKKTSDDGSEREAILGNWPQLQNLTKYRINRDHFKELQWGEGEKTLQEYVQTVDDSLEYLANVTRALLELNEFSKESIRSAKQKRSDVPGQKMTISEAVEKKLKAQDDKGPKYLPFILEYIDFSQQIGNITEDNFDNLIDRIIKLNLFSDPQDQSLFQAIFEGLDFRQVCDFRQFSLTKHINSFKDIFSPKTKELVFKKLILAEQGNEKKEFYELAIRLIDENFTEVPEFLNNFKQDCKKKLIKYSNPKQAMKMYLKELPKEKNPEKLYNLVNDIALILFNKGLIFEAGMVYKAGKNFSQAMNCLRSVGETEIDYAIEHINLLTDLTLFQEAIRYCITSASKFNFASRARLQDALKNTSQARKKYPSDPLKLSLLDPISKQQLGEIESIAKRSIDSL